MGKIFRKMNLSTKVVCTMTMLIFAYGLIFVIVSMRNTRTELYSQIEDSNQRALEQFNKELDTLQNDLINMTSLVYTNDIMMEFVRGTQDINNTQSRSYINNFLLSSLLFKDVVGFAGITNDGSFSESFYTTKDNSFGMNSYDELIDTKIFRDFRESGMDYAIYPLCKEDTSIISQNRADKLLFIRTIRDPQKNFSLIGYFLLGINLSKITEICEPLLDTSNSAICVLDASKAEIYTYGQSIPLKEHVEKGFDQKNYHVREDGNYLLCETNRNQFGWSIYYYTDISGVIQQNFWNSYAYLILIALAAVSVFGIIANIFAKALVSPLKELLASMAEFQKGDFQQSVPVRNDDEIGRLTEGYNRMVERIRELIRQNYEIKLKENEAQLGALQAQINPHFLYNTLDLLYWKTIMSGQDALAQNIYSMSRLFRLSLNKGEMWLTIESEKEFLTHYLYLQKALMSDKLDFTVEVEAGLEKTEIPRFLLQPFVENAIIHGFREIKRIPEIHVLFQKANSDLIMIILDNGCGMTQEDAARIFSQDSSHEPDSADSYAISNVIRRLTLYFGEDYSLNAESTVSAGTQITLVLKNFLSQGGDISCTKLPL